MRRGTLALLMIALLAAPASAAHPSTAMNYREAKHYIKRALADRFGGAFTHAYGKRVAGCERRSRSRVRCNRVSWVIGDGSYVGTAQAWFIRRKGETYYDAAFTIRLHDEYCLATGGSNCVRTYRKR